MNRLTGGNAFEYSSRVTVQSMPDIKNEWLILDIQKKPVCCSFQYFVSPIQFLSHRTTVQPLKSCTCCRNEHHVSWHYPDNYWLPCAEGLCNKRFSEHLLVGQGPHMRPRSDRCRKVIAGMVGTYTAQCQLCSTGILKYTIRGSVWNRRKKSQCPGFTPPVVSGVLNLTRLAVDCR